MAVDQNRAAIEAVPALVRDLYTVVAKLEALFPGRHFTPDGHLVGSIGEVLAAYHYGLDLHAASTPCQDGVCPSGRRVQVKATQGESIGINEQPDFLIVLKLRRDGTFEEVFNGPGAAVWNAAGPVQKTSQRPIRLSTLRTLNASVPEGDRIRRVR